MSAEKCCCVRADARECFLHRHPECQRRTDSPGREDLYEAAIDEVCECHCHYDERDDDYHYEDFDDET